ncbi:MAG: Rrf2 family transcriptional regulator [Siculibacillus sp.]|nr:Rrf2 family transcriptional regulator [Siculibacillus sp.]
MRLTSYSNYTLRILMIAAVRSPDLTTVQDVADAFGISKAHLVKCVHRLGLWGYIETVRGNGGGFRLTRPSATISLGEVIRRTEDGFSLVECFDPASDACPLVRRCRLRPALLRSTEAFLDALDEMTLAEISDNGDELLDVLDLAAPDASACRAAAATA